jgi:hypothetical protein
MYNWCALMSPTKIHNSLARLVHRILQRSKRRVARRGTMQMVSALAMSEEAFLALFDLGQGPPSKTTLLTHYGRRVTLAWPAPPSIIRDLRVNLDELYKE